MDAAISYKRFSSPKQARGDSDRRQTDLAEEYCKRNDLMLVDTYLDAGLSGFTGENLTDSSSLRALLHAAKSGKFSPGTRLIVESLDRLSRAEITTAVRLFLDLLDTGLVIVTLIDGEQVFTKERVDTDLTALIIAIVFVSRANNESRNRRERALQAQQTARKKARENKTPITAECPKWLTVVGKRDARKFVVIEDRAKIVERIFNMSAGGMGQVQIISFLNRHHVATFSGKPKWRPGMIGHLLSNEAVFGRFQPCLSVVEGGRRRRVPDPEGAIENYFPAVISRQLFNQGRRATRGRLRHQRDRKIPAYANLVPRIGRCGVCSATLHHFRDVGPWAYLRCSNARYQECSNRFGFPYKILEAVLLVLDSLIELVANLTLKSLRLGVAGHPATGKTSVQIGNYDSVTATGLTFAEHETALIRFKEIKLRVSAEDEEERDYARRSLVLEIRRLVDGVVLHSNHLLTIHMRPDPLGHRVVYVVSRDGLQGVQIKSPVGITGFIDRAVFAEIVGSAMAAGGVGRGPVNADELLQRACILRSADGDWQVVVPDPMRMADLVARAERTLETHLR